MVGTFITHPAGCLQAWGASPAGPLQEGSGLLHKVTGHTTTVLLGREACFCTEGLPRGLVPRVTGHGLFHADLDGGGRLCPPHKPASCLGCREPHPGKRQVGLSTAGYWGEARVHSS